MQDDLERSDKMLSVLYPLSLLYFVSGVLEASVDCPLLGMQRYYSRIAPFDPAVDDSLRECLQFLDAGISRNIWSIAGPGPGSASRSVKHGDFDNDPTTLESVRFLLENGF
jgi:hypothetical protein